MVEAKKGQRLSVEVEGMRFGQTLFDPYIAILDEKRFELSAVDDSPLVRQDAVTSITVPEDGKYIIEMRESGYGGNGNCRYRLHVGQFPRPTAIYPAGGKAGEEVEFTFIGDAGGPITAKGDFARMTAQRRCRSLLRTTGVLARPGHVVRVSPDPNTVEAEPNNASGRSDCCCVSLLPLMACLEVLQVTTTTFKFTAKKGQTYEVECYGRRIRTGIDPVMNISFGLRTGKVIERETTTHVAPTVIFVSKFPKTANMPCESWTISVVAVLTLSTA